MSILPIISLSNTIRFVITKYVFLKNMIVMVKFIFLEKN